VRSGLRGLGDLGFGLLRALNIPASMYGNPHSVKNEIYQVAACIALRFVVGIGRKALCFGRFPHQLDHSNALHQFTNHVRSLTVLVRSFPISPCPLVGPRTNEAYGHPNARRISSDALPLRCGYDRNFRWSYRSFEEFGSATSDSYGPSHPPLRGMSKVLDAISPRPQPVLQRFLPRSDGYRLTRGVHAVLLLRDDAGAQPLEVG
jgi:hypothetical protein